MRLAEARRGIALIEVLIALTLLSVGALAWVSLASQTMHTLDIMLARESEMRRASRLLSAYAARSASELAAAAGRRHDGGFRVVVSRESPTLFTVEVSAAEGKGVLLWTAFHRELPADATR